MFLKLFLRGCSCTFLTDLTLWNKWVFWSLLLLNDCKLTHKSIQMFLCSIIIKKNTNKRDANTVWSSDLQAERGSVERGGVTETEPHTATESHEQGQSSHIIFTFTYCNTTTGVTQDLFPLKSHRQHLF